MEISPNPKKELRAKIFAIATAVVFALAFASVSIAPAGAAEHGGRGGGGHGGGYRGGGGYHRGGGWHGGGWGGGYYAPGPDIYVAPEPYVYSEGPCDYGPGYDGPEYYCSPPPPPGVNLFFGL